MAIKNQNHILSAVVSFAGIARPTLAEKSRLKDLILGHIDNLDPTEQTAICSGLAACPNAPLDLLLHLCELDADICCSLLVGSKAFTDAELSAILAGNLNVQKARIISRNPSIGPLSIRHLRALYDAKVDQSLDIRQRPQRSDFENSKAPEHNLLMNDPRIEALLESLQDEEDGIAHTALADALGLGLPSIIALCSDPTSRNLPLALRFLKLACDEAWLVYTRLAQKITTDANIQNEFYRVYSSLEMSECNAIVSRWQMDELVAIVRERHVANDSNPASTSKTKNKVA